MLDKAKMVYEAQRLKSALAKEVIEVETGNGAVVIEVTGEQKIKRIKLDPEKIDPDDLSKLEKWLESAANQAFTRSQQLAAEKMKPLMDKLGISGF